MIITEIQISIQRSSIWADPEYGLQIQNTDTEYWQYKYKWICWVVYLEGNTPLPSFFLEHFFWALLSVFPHFLGLFSLPPWICWVVYLVGNSPLPAWDSWPSISIDWCISRGNDTAEPLSWYLHNLHWYLCNQSAMVAQSWYSFKHFSAIKHWLLSKTHQWYLLDSVQLILEQLLQSLSGVILPMMILQSMDSVHSWWFWHKCSTSKIFLHESSTDCSTNGLSDGFLSLIN